MEKKKRNEERKETEVERKRRQERERKNKQREAKKLKIIIERHSCGQLNVECQYCKALHFPGEKPSDGKFKTCCHKGKVKLERPPYPETLKRLLFDVSSRNHAKIKNNIRSYNSAVAFASMGAQIEEYATHGPYCFRIHGQIYHTTSHLHPQEGQIRKYAQLYVIEAEEALQKRMELPPNQQCLPEVLSALDEFFRENNVYAKSFKMLHEIEKEQRQKAKVGNNPEMEVSLIFRRDRGKDRRRYNLPTTDEVAMIYSSETGEPPFERDIQVYPISNENLITINILSPNLDPMTYPIFYPFGEAGWQPNWTAESYNGKRSHITMLQYKVALLAIRKEEFNVFLHGGKLSQQWITDSALQVTTLIKRVSMHIRLLLLSAYKLTGRSK